MDELSPGQRLVVIALAIGPILIGLALYLMWPVSRVVALACAGLAVCDMALAGIFFVLYQRQSDQG